MTKEKASAEAKKDPLIHFPFYCHQYLGRLLQFSFEERGLFITALAIMIVEDGYISNDILLRRCGFKNQQVSENNQADSLSYLLDEVRILAEEIMDVQKPLRETKRLNGSKGGRRSDDKKPAGYQAVSKSNRKASYTDTEKETETEIKLDKEAEDFDKSKSFDEFHLSIANQLADHIRKSKQISISAAKIKNWAKEIHILEKKDLQGRQSAFDDIQNALQTLSNHDGEPFFPTIESGKSFRDKFTKIENFLARSVAGKSKPDQFTKNVSASMQAINNALIQGGQNGL